MAVHRPLTPAEQLTRDLDLADATRPKPRYDTARDPVITSEMIRKLDPCSSVEVFDRLFPTGMPATEKNIRRAMRFGLLADWVTAKLPAELASELSEMLDSAMEKRALAHRAADRAYADEYAAVMAIFVRTNWDDVQTFFDTYAPPRGWEVAGLALDMETTQGRVVRDMMERDALVRARQVLEDSPRPVYLAGEQGRAAE